MLDISREHGDSKVWRLEGESDSAVLKQHTVQRKFEQELAAYRRWTPHLGSAAARLLEAWEEERSLLLSLLPGRTLDGAELSDEAERGVHRAAGSLLRALHDLPCGEADNLPLPEAYERRMEAWIRRAEASLPHRIVAEVRRLIQDALPLLEGRARVPCHRDFTPRNWLVSSSRPGFLAVIDFEHSRPDLSLVDLVRLEGAEWRGRDGLREAFMEGYGGLPDDDRPILHALCALDALGTVTWAREHGDGDFERRGLRALQDLGITHPK